MKQFISEVVNELHKIEWPSFEEFVGSTIVTLLLVVFFAVFIGGVDKVLSFAARYIFSQV